MRLTLIAFTLAAVLSACDDNKSRSTSSLSSAAGPPIPGAATGQLIFDIPGNVDDSTVQGYVVGSQNELAVTQADNGTYYIDNIPPGNVDIVVTGALVVTTQLAGETPVGVRKNRVLVTAGSSSSPGAVSLYPLGAITGKVKRSGSTNHEGIFVSIPGTDFGEVRTTDAEGNYSFADVPAGDHRLLFQSNGYRDGRIENVEVKPSRSTAVDELLLALSTGPDGSLVINDGATYSNSPTVSLALNASSDAELMKISEDVNFSGLVWEPVRTYRSWTFSSAGKKTLYVTFADANGLETSPAKAEITIDFFSDGTTAFTPGFSLVASTVPANNAIFQLSGIKVPPQATSMLVYDVAASESAVWVTPSTAASITFANAVGNCGSHILGVKFKTTSGTESEAATRSVSINCWRDASSSGAPPVNSLGMLHAWTGSRLLLWGGYVPTGMSTQTDWTSGYQYDGITETWSNLPTSGQPTTRGNHGSAYVPDKLFIWGGSVSGNCNLDTGAVFTESTQTWSAVSTTSAPDGRCPSVTFGYRDPNDSKYKVLIWGGNENGAMVNTGFIYSIPDNSWSTVNSTNRPSAPGSFVQGVFGDKYYIFGSSGSACNTPDSYGKSYTLSSGTWLTTSSPGTMLDTGLCENTSTRGFFEDNKFYIFTNKTVSGSKEYTVKAAIYDPASDTWTAIPMTNGPQNRTAFGLVYTGTKIVVLGGTGNGFDGGEFPSVVPTYLADGYSFDLANQTWSHFVPAGMLARSDSKTYYLPGSGIITWYGQYFAMGHATSSITTLIASPP